MSDKYVSIPSIPQKAYRFYTQNGFLGLAKGSVTFIMIHILRHQSVSATDIHDARDNHKIWYSKQEDQIVVSDPDHPKLRQAFANYPKQFQPDRGFVCELQDCHLVGEYATGLFQGRKLISETYGERLNDKFLGSRAEITKNIIKPKMWSNINSSDANIFPLISPDPSYYHWITEYLPKLRLLELYQDATNKEPTILIESDPRHFICDTLNCAGYGPDRYREWDKKEVSTNNLVVCTHRPHLFLHGNPASKYDLSRLDLEWLRKRMRSNTFDTDLNFTPSKRIYISRQNASRGRKVINYKQIIDILQRYGFESYNLEDYTFQEQLKIFDKAEIIVGPHGAGLVNMIFSENPTIVELFPYNVIEPYFYHISDIFNFGYDAIVSKSDDNNNIVINTRELDNLIDRITHS